MTDLLDFILIARFQHQIDYDTWRQIAKSIQMHHYLPQKTSGSVAAGILSIETDINRRHYLPRARAVIDMIQ